MRRSLLLFVSPLVLLGGCAGVARGPQQAEAAPPPAESAYGMFLAGQGALNDGRSQEAARFFDAARGQPGADQVISEKAFTAALLAGDIPRAATLAPTGDEASEAAKRLGALVRGVEAMAEDQGKVAVAELTSESIAFPHKSAAALLAPWAAAQAGDLEGSLARPQVRGDKLVDYFGGIGRGLLFERAKRYDEAETDLKAAAAGETPSEIAVLAYGGFLERRGRRLEAVALYTAALGDGQSEAVAVAKARAAAGKAAPAAPTLREGAAQAMLAPTVTMIAAKQHQIALAYLRLLLRLDPKRDEAWVMVGDIMQAGGDTDSARQAYARPRPGSPEYIDAQGKLAWTYEQADDHVTALRIAQAAASSGAADARLTLADLLRANERYAESVTLMDELIKEAPAPDWRLYFGRAVSLEKLGRWSEAETDLQAALKLRPEEPELLNYLGYSWIDRGVRLPEALAMVEKAVAANPRSGAMVDSLGWAYFRLGDYKQAVEKLEQAVELEAGDPEVNDHLGDAYWKVGRRDEALFQWRRVLTLKPDDKIRLRAQAKLASPLGPEGPSALLAGD
ncbi:tetratricopeptide repeat protein [Phenylobacterium sp. LjRoot219]|uniref:tetratricopeptide repeat protein n=1 Tax=Phenylobacterium sp. LjRoot219 TaxID=3342283 RepID=UPI003ECD8126